MERIGLLGGTFDPPHYGHLWLAETATHQLRLDRVLFMPVGQPPHKAGRNISPTEQRIQMTRLAIAGNSAFFLDNTDAQRPPPHHTASLLPLVRRRYPRAEFWLLIGSDSMNELPRWHDPIQIIRLCRLAILSRPGTAVDWVTISQAVEGVDTVSDILDGPALSLSSTEIRSWRRTGRSIRYLLPPGLEKYVQDTQLYR